MPNKALVQRYLRYSLILGVTFILFYGGANWINETRSDHLHLYFSWELSLPFVPELILVYLSLQLLFLTPIIHCTEDEIVRLARQMGTSIVIASLIFVVLPTTSGFDRLTGNHEFSSLFSALYVLDKPYNLFPSLHVALAVLVYSSVVTPQLKWVTRAFYTVWLLLMTVSVLLVHQHHFADIAGGVLLALLCSKLFPQHPNSQRA